MSLRQYAIDGCSAPNFALSLEGFARGLAAFAAAEDAGGGRGAAMRGLNGDDGPSRIRGRGRGRLHAPYAGHGGRAAVKTGAEGVFAAIIPENVWESPSRSRTAPPALPRP
jgi:L-asparaginase II